MYLVLHLYPVQQKYVEELLKVNHKAANIYKEYGAIEDKTLKHNPKKGNLGACMRSYDIKENEVYIMKRPY